MLRLFRALALVLVATLPVAAARGAETDAKQKASALIDEGNANFEHGDYERALGQFQKAYEIFPSYKILLNIGGALRKLGREVEAAENYERFLEEASRDERQTPSDPNHHPLRGKAWQSSVPRASAVLLDLRKRIGRLRIEILPPGAFVELDGRPIASEPPRSFYVAPGTHYVRAAAPGFVPEARTLGIAAGEDRRLALTLLHTSAPKPPSPESSVPQEAPADSAGQSRYRVWTWVAMASTGALLVAGIAVALHAHSVFDDYENKTLHGQPVAGEDRFHQAETEATVANVLFAGAGAAAIATGVLFFVEGRAHTQVASRLRPVPMGTLGLALRGQF